MKKALILQLARFGDILQSIPLLINLKRKKNLIDFVFDEKNFIICKDIPFIDNLIPFRINENLSLIQQNNLKDAFKLIKDFIEKLNKNNYQKLVNLNHSQINLLLTKALSSIPERIGFNIENRSFFEFLYDIIQTSRKLNPFNIVDVFNHFIENPEVVRIKLSESLKSVLNLDFNFIIIHLGAGHHLRILDIEIMSEFASLFLQRYSDINIILTGVDKEKNLGKIFQKKVKSNRIHDFIGRTDLYELKYLLKRAKILISTDTGIIHLASAMGTNIIGLYYASAFPFETGPYTENALILTPKIDCYPCYEFSHCNNFKCKKLIKENDIIECCKFFLEGVRDLKFSPNIIAYKPFFDNFGIYLNEITDKRDDLKPERDKIRDSGIKLC